jgi:hypothetical protein
MHFRRGKGGDGIEFKRRLVEAQVSVVDSHRLILQCDQCGQCWSPNLLSGGRLPRGYWKCPNGCSSEEIPRLGYRQIW